MGNAPFVPRGKQGRALCFRLKQANTSRLSKKPQNRLEQKTSGRYKLVVQEGQAPRMGIIGNTLIESPRTPFSANTLLWTPFGATQTGLSANFDDTAPNAVSSRLSGLFQLGKLFIFPLMTNAVFAR